MINTIKEVLIYNKSAPFNLNSLNLSVKNKIEKISRVNPSTGTSYQVWSPGIGVLQFSALTCSDVYIFESNTIGFNLTNDNSSDGLVKPINYSHNICGNTVTATPSLSVTITPTPIVSPTPTVQYGNTIVPPLIDVNGGATVTVFNLNDSPQNIAIEREYLSNPGIWISTGSLLVSANNTITTSLGSAGLPSKFRARVFGQPTASDTYNYATGNISPPIVNGGSTNPTLTISNPNSEPMFAQLHYKLKTDPPGSVWLDYDINIYIQPNTVYTYPTNDTTHIYRARLYSPGTGTFVSSWGYSPPDNVLDPVGKLLFWGNNASGQLGTGNTSNKITPYQINNTDWHMVSAGLNHTAAIKGDGTLWTWGSNSSGQLGHGMGVASLSTPTQLGNDTWLSISAGANYTIGIRSDRTMWAWGTNVYYQLGILNDNNTKWTPIQIGLNRTWLKVSAGVYHTLAISSDNLLFACGYNIYSQCAGGAANYIQVMTQIGNLLWQDVEAGLYHSMGLGLTGDVLTWGYNLYGQLGNNTNNILTGPSPINNNKYSAIAAGYNHCVAIRSDNTLWSWGDNGGGQLGINNKIGSKIPTQVGSSASWMSISSNADHNVAIQNNGSLWAWGLNNTYQLGDGTTLEKLIPINIDTKQWKSVSAGYNFSCGIES